MLLNIIIIVLRETLEASILIAVLLSVSFSQNIKFSWVPMAMLAGFIGAICYGYNLGSISEWLDYAGQEVVSAGLQLIVYLLICLLVSLHWQSTPVPKNSIRVLMSTIVCTALIREGGELYIFYTGFLQKEEVLLQAIMSGFIGLAVGLSVGAVVYYALAVREQSQAKLLHVVVLTLVAAGMMLQATQLLIQVDWLSAGEPLWDSNWLIPEPSVVGQLVYAIFGYEATPSIIEVGVYSLSIAGVIMAATLFTHCWKRRSFI